MIINKKDKIQKISAKISTKELELAKAYIQGAVHSHCNANPAQPFSVRSLFGGNNKDWSNTPLQCIYNYHHKISGTQNPTEQAAKDIGWIFKDVLNQDTRHFEFVGKNTGNIYKQII